MNRKILPPKKGRSLRKKEEIVDIEVEEKAEETKVEEVIESVEEETPDEEGKGGEIGDNEKREANTFYAKWQKKKNKYKGSSYDPIKDAGWKKDDKGIPYSALADLFDKVGANSSRLSKIEHVSNFVRSVVLLHPHELTQVIYLCSNKIAAPYEGIELGIGDSIIYRALVKSTGRKQSEMKAEMDKCGDLGTVAVNSRKRQRLLFKPKPLTVAGVDKELRKVASIKGGKSSDTKIGIINKMFVAAKGIEAKYITRHLLGKSMKLGLAEQTVFAALAKACATTPPALSSPILDLSKKIDPEKFQEMIKDYDGRLKQVLSELPNYDIVLKSLVTYGFPSLHSRCHLTPGIPVKAMLAKPTTGVQEILERFSDCRFTLEYKYDGERAQIPLLPDGSVRIFS